VAALVGGFYSQQKHAGQVGVIFNPVPKQKQAEAVRFLNENAFRTPRFALNPEILRRIEPAGSVARINAAQRLVLTNLLDGGRFNRLVEQEASEGVNAYSPGAFLADVRKGIFAELFAAAPKVDAHRRGLQRGYLAVVSEKLNGRTPVNDDQRAWLRGELHALQSLVVGVSARMTDRAGRVHVEDLKDQITKILDPKVAFVASGGPSLAPRPSLDSLDCWHDYESEALR